MGFYSIITASSLFSRLFTMSDGAKDGSYPVKVLSYDGNKTKWHQAMLMGGHLPPYAGSGPIIVKKSIPIVDWPAL
jgi:hypothetical protein